MVLLVTSDNEQFVVDKEVAERSVLIKNMLEGAYLGRATACGPPLIFQSERSSLQMLVRAINPSLSRTCRLVC